MANQRQLGWLVSAAQAAQKAGHKWPAAAACEAADESAWGISTPPNSNNVLGIKVFSGWTGPAVDANGTEQRPDGSWTGPQLDKWCVFPDLEGCFAEQVRILQEPRYAEAMAATAIEDYILKESAVWSTSLAKGRVVLAIYNAHKEALDAALSENISLVSAENQA